MSIGVRLESIAAQVVPGSKVADIGTDHAYVPVWLLEKQIVTQAIATDIGAGPCQAARANIAARGLSKQIAVRQGNGLACLRPGEVDTLIIAGMGGSTIVQILTATPEVTGCVDRLILQPMVGAVAVRKWCLSNGFTLAGEHLCAEAGRYYVILVWKRGQSHLTYSEVELEVGPLLLQQQGPLFSGYVQHLLEHTRHLLEQMQESQAAVHSEKYGYLQRLQAALEVLGCASDSR